MKKIIVPPITEPIISETKGITAPWYQFFQSLAKGINEQKEQEEALSAEIEQLKQRIAELEN